MKLHASMKTIAVYQAMGPEQLAALIRADWRRIEPGRCGEHFFFLKLQQRYAEMIARQRELAVHGAGYVVRLILPAKIVNAYDLETVAYEEHLEYRVPVCELEEINRYIIGEVSMVSIFIEQHSYSIVAGQRPLAGLMG